MVSGKCRARKDHHPSRGFIFPTLSLVFVWSSPSWPCIRRGGGTAHTPRATFMVLLSLLSWLLLLSSLTCAHNRLRWWWGWSAWPSGTLSRCSSTWRRCCCGGSRTCRSYCLRGVGSGSQSGSAPCGQSRVHTLGNELRALQCRDTEIIRNEIKYE